MRAASTRTASIRAASAFTASWRCASAFEASGFGGSTAPFRASCSIRAPSASPGSRSGVALSGLEAGGASAATGVGTSGLAGTTHVSTSVSVNAITACAGFGREAVSPVRSVRKGTFTAGAPLSAAVRGLASAVALVSGVAFASAVALAAAFGFPPALEPASAFGLVSGTFGEAVRSAGSAWDTDGPAGRARGRGGSSRATGKGSAIDETACSAGAVCAGTTTTRRSGISARRSCQGKPKPGSQSPWPPKVRLNSNAWINSESSSAYVSRVCSRLADASLELVEFNRALPLLPGHFCGRGAIRRRVLRACQRAMPTGHDLATGPRRHA